MQFQSKEKIEYYLRNRMNAPSQREFHLFFSSRESPREKERSAPNRHSM